MVAFWRLTRSRELMVTRAAGVSAWQFLLPVLVLAFVLGLLKIMAFNPAASALLTRYERLNSAYLKGQTNLLAISQSGLWLRQANEKSQSVVHAYRVSLDGADIALKEVTIFVYSGTDRFESRVTAKSGKLEDGFWHLRDVWIYQPDRPLRHADEHWFATDLTLDNIQDSFAPPETMSFWDLPEFIDNLDRAGFSALRHRLYWHSLLAAPLLLCAMILIAATFTLRQSRTGNTAFIIMGGVFAGFVLFFFSDIVFALGLRDSIPIALAAWTPSGIFTLLGLAMVFHLEDG
jgi:lipopolysaccharide export system permease protein